MNKIEAIILDLDGTLLNDNKNISEDTINFLKSISKDIKIILASARQFVTIKPYLEQLDLINKDNYTICFNGSLVVDNLENEIVNYKIDSNIIKNIDSFILENNIDWTYYLYGYRFLRTDINNIEDIIKNDIYKIVGISSIENINNIRNNLDKYIIDNLEVTSSELNRIEFVKKGITKVKAIEMLLNKLNIDKSNVIAIGDGDNDIDMIKYVGYGVAMLNSPDKVKNSAKIITKYTNNEDGVYKVIIDILEGKYE